MIDDLCALIATWRSEASESARQGGPGMESDAFARNECADELESLLLQNPRPAGGWVLVSDLEKMADRWRDEPSMEFRAGMVECADELAELKRWPTDLRAARGPRCR